MIFQPNPLLKCEMVVLELNRKNHFCDYVECWVWIWSYINNQRLFWKIWTIKILLQSSRWGVFQLNPLLLVWRFRWRLTESKLMLTRNVSSIVDMNQKQWHLFGFLKQSVFWCKQPIQHFFMRSICNYLKAFTQDLVGRNWTISYGEKNSWNMSFLKTLWITCPSGFGPKRENRKLKSFSWNTLVQVERFE